MKTMSVRLVHFVVAHCLATLFSLHCLADPPVLKWDDAAGTNVWNSTVTNWIDSADSNVVWQTGAQALFEGSGGTVDIEEDVTASNLVFSAGGYTLSGIGLLTVEGALSGAGATDNTLSAELRSSGTLTKSGAGTITLANPDAQLVNPVVVSEGTLALQDTAIPGTVSVADGASVTALPSARTGLTGFYYNVSPNGANFASLDMMEAHFAALTPDLVALSSEAGTDFDFGSTGALFPLPYGLGGDHTNNFEVIWRGTVIIPASDTYFFRFVHDDGILLAIDRQVVVHRTVNTTTEGSAFLEAGTHDVVLGFYQGTGPCGLHLEVKSIHGAYGPLPNAWLRPYSSVGVLGGIGEATLSASGSSFRTTTPSATTFTGALTGPDGSLFTKAGWGAMTLSSSTVTSNALAGDVAIEGGVLTLATDERVGDDSTVLIGQNSGLTVAASETLGALAGPGTVTLGNDTKIRLYPFTGDADCGISTNKIYTHLLDFPANNAATVNGVAFVPAGMNGSANGYTWSTTGNPPTGTWADSGSGVAQLLADFTYGGTDYTLTLSGLTPGQSYETRIYFRSFGSVNPDAPRKLTFFFSSGSAFIGSLFYNPDAQYARSILSCRYTADASGSLSVRILVHNSGHTCHLYGLSNEETDAPDAPNAPAATYPRGVEFTNDADSGLSTGKSYTHLLDFPNNGNPATVNGVNFLAAGLSGNAHGHSRGLTARNAPNDSTGTGVDRLLWDFLYNSTDYTLTLAGLNPGRTYETRLYFRSFGTVGTDTPRDVTFTFTAGANLIGSVVHDLDTLARSRVECRYTADAAGSISIRVYSPDSGHSCHLYGLSNEEVNAPAILTLNTPADSAARHTGAVTGYGTLVKRGEGTQSMGGINRLSTPLELQEGTLSLEPGASVLAGVALSPGTTLASAYGNVWLGGLSGSGTLDLSVSAAAPYPLTGRINFTYFTNDLTTGISPSKTYTHLMDLGTRANVAVINGVTFNKVSSQNGSVNGYGWVNFPPNPHGGNVPPVGHSVPAGTGAYDLLYDMDYGWANPPDAKTMQITGLTPGKLYEAHLFNRAWGWGANRWQTITFDPDGAGPIAESVSFNPDAMNANYLSYRYRPTSTTLSITILSAQNNQTYHLYGFTNEEAHETEYESVTIDLAQDGEFPGLITGAGSLIKTGAGTLTLTATNDATGLVAVNGGAFGVTGGGTATLGPVTVASGATLFGDGSIGGDVTVASNATIRAGTASACGTLAVGGDLTLEPGAMPIWYFDSDENDLITVDGLLTIPAAGVLHVESITGGTKPPNKATVFSSTQPIEGPADLSGWTVQGATVSSISYSIDHKKILFIRSSGTIILVR